jgi:FkbM family methyltransferase
VIRPLIASHRTNPVIRRIARGCRRFLDQYENFDYDPRSNGEAAVLGRLAGCGLQCLFDVGANRGEWALLAHRLHPRASIHCFEIHPTTADVLRARTAHVAAIFVNGVGLSSQPDDVPLHCYGEHDALTTMIGYPHGMSETMGSGRVTTGDLYVEQHGIEQIDFLKLDVEGAEPMVLGGFDKTIGRGRVGVIQFEYGRVSLVTRFLLGDFYALLTARGYRIGKLYPTYVDFKPYELADEDFIGPNYIAVHRSRPDMQAALEG